MQGVPQKLPERGPVSAITEVVAVFFGESHSLRDARELLSLFAKSSPWSQDRLQLLWS